MKTLTLSSPQAVIAVPATSAVTVTTNSIIISKYDDDGSTQVSADIIIPIANANPLNPGSKRTLILWNGSTSPTYSAIGDWTEAQAEARIKALLGVS